MAYTPPEQWSHGDYPTAAKMNKYKDGLDAIYAAFGTYPINPAVARRISPTQGYYFLHSHRWLLYRGAGTIEDSAGVGETINLSEAEDMGWTNFDLDTIDWMRPGKLYQVQGVIACLEDYEPLA